MVRTALAVGVVVVAAVAAPGCGGSPARPPVTPPVVARPIAMGDLEGAWRATDIDGWVYELAVHGDRYDQMVRRTAGGPCAQKGTVQSYEKLYGSPYVPPNPGGQGVIAGGDGYGGTTYGAAATAPPPILAIVVTLEQNQCNADYTGAQLIMVAEQYDGDAFTLRTITWGGAAESHRYQRDVPAPATK